VRILYITRSDSAHDQRFLKALAESKHDIYALRISHQGKDPVTPEGVKEVPWSKPTSKLTVLNIPVLVGRLKKIIDTVKPDLIHAGPIQDGAFLAAKTGFSPLMSMSWGFDLLKDAERNAWMRRLTKYALKHSQILFVDCQTVAKKAQSLGYGSGQLFQMPWGVDVNWFSPAQAKEPGRKLRESLGWQDKFVLLGLRAWEPNYGVNVLAKAFVRAAQAEPKLRLILLNQGSQEKEIRSILAEGKISSLVYFGGRVQREDLPKFNGAADLYISPSHVDGSSVSLLEAMACGTPCLVSDIPSNLEWIEQGVNGLVFQDGSVESLVSAIIGAVQSSKLQDFAEKSHNLIIQKADWDKNFAKLLQTYEAIPKNLRENYEK